jgi:hypothetical protein
MSIGQWMSIPYMGHLTNKSNVLKKPHPKKNLGILFDHGTKYILAHPSLASTAAARGRVY